MEGFIIGGVVLAAILFLRSQDQETGTGAYAVVRQDSDDDGASDAFTPSSRLSLFEHSSLSNDDDWPTSSIMDDCPVTDSYEPITSMDTDWWTDPAYASLPGNIYHDTLIDPTHDDDSISSFNDSCSVSLFDDSFSNSSSIDDSFSSSSSFDD